MAGAFEREEDHEHARPTCKTYRWGTRTHQWVCVCLSPGHPANGIGLVREQLFESHGVLV